MAELTDEQWKWFMKRSMEVYDQREDLVKEQAQKAEEPLFKTYSLGTDPIVSNVIDKFYNRSQEGMKKYGVPMTRTDISTLEWLKHAQEEAMDMAVYLERLIQDYSK